MTLQDGFRIFADRLDKISAGALKVDAMAAGQVVPPFEVLDAAHKKVIDGSHSSRTTGSTRTAPPCCSPALPPAPSAWTTPTSWAGCGRAADTSCD